MVRTDICVQGTQPWKAGGVAASVNCIYTVVQGCLYSGEMSGHWVVALLVTSAALSICQVVALSRIWRPTSRASLLLAEARLLDTAIVTVISRLDTDRLDTATEQKLALA